MPFKNRSEAGRLLADKLRAYADRDDVIILAVPRGGVPVAFELAVQLRLPLDVFVLRKLGVPGQEELAFGAIAEGGVQVLDREIVDYLNLSPAQIGKVAQEELRELDRRLLLYRSGRPATQMRGRTVIVVDDGVATGSSARAAIEALRQFSPAKIVLAVPVAPAPTCARLRLLVDDLVVLNAPEDFQAIGQFYEDFSPVTDETVIDLLARSGTPASISAGGSR